MIKMIFIKNPFQEVLESKLITSFLQKNKKPSSVTAILFINIKLSNFKVLYQSFFWIKISKLNY